MRWKGSSWCANPERTTARTRRTSSRKLGAPARSTRSGRTFAKRPIRFRTSGRFRPAVEAKTIASSARVRRRSSACSPATTTMKSVACSLRATRLRRAVAAASSDHGRRAAGPIEPAGDDVPGKVSGA